MQLPACRGSGLYYVLVGARMKTDLANSQRLSLNDSQRIFAQQKSGGRKVGTARLGLADAPKG
eukprot:scaffold14005_cov67-Skeletonema_marinoi.AAC.2